MVDVDVEELGPDPLAAFGRWLADVVRAGLPEPTAMVLATVDAGGGPAARTVLLKGYDERGLRFFTNLGSAKSADLAAHPRAALVFPWHAIYRQVRATGPVVELDRDEVAAYFATRPRDSQLGAWASAQSQVVASRAALDSSYDEIVARFPDEVPAPPFWGGYRVVPDTGEFWVGRAGRLHDRMRYRRTTDDPDVPWTIERLAP